MFVCRVNSHALYVSTVQYGSTRSERSYIRRILWVAPLPHTFRSLSVPFVRKVSVRAKMESLGQSNPGRASQSGHEILPSGSQSFPNDQKSLDSYKPIISRLGSMDPWPAPTCCLFGVDAERK